MKNAAVIDIDNTLWQFCDAFYVELKKVNNAFPTIEQWTTADFWTSFCTEQQFMEAINAIHENQDSDKYRPYPNAKEFLAALKEQGYHVIIASHRRTETREPTERWLRAHGLAFDDLHLSFDKSVLFKDAAVVVDDAPQTLEKAVANRAIGAGLLFPWNKAYAGNGFGLFGDLNMVLAYIEGRGAESGKRKEG
ncbi:MAG: HAD family hydrolase [Nitrospirota bacterium]